MSLESIYKRIINDANIQKRKIIQEAKREADSIIREGKQEANALYQDLIAKAKIDSENQRQRLIVNARLEHKKSLLYLKQKLIDSVFRKLKSTLKKEKLKKKQVSLDKIKEVPEDIDFYLNKLRLEYEIEIAKILFPQK